MEDAYVMDLKLGALGRECLSLEKTAVETGSKGPKPSKQAGATQQQ